MTGSANDKALKHYDFSGSTKMKLKGNNNGTLDMGGATFSGTNPIEILAGSTLKLGGKRPLNNVISGAGTVTATLTEQELATLRSGSAVQLFKIDGSTLPTTVTVKDSANNNYTATAEGGYCVVKFSVHTAVGFAAGDNNWSSITWDPAVTTPVSSIRVLNVTAASTLTFDTTPGDVDSCLKVTGAGALTIKMTGSANDKALKHYDFSGSTGGVTIDASGMNGNDYAKYAVVGAPYSYWLTPATIAGTYTVTPPTVVTGYTVADNYVAGYGLRLVFTAPSTAKYGSININFMGNEQKATSDDNAKVGSLTTEVGGHPVVGTSWNDLEGKNQTDTTVSKYVQTDGTVVTSAGIKLTASQVANSYGSGAANNMLITGYMDDGSSPIVQISNIPFSKYRVILYRATDEASKTFSAAQIGTMSSDTKIYYGPTSGSTTAGNTLIGTTETTWGKSDWRTGYAESVNYIVSDVLEGTAGSATATSIRTSTRAVRVLPPFRSSRSGMTSSPMSHRSARESTRPWRRRLRRWRTVRRLRSCRTAPRRR